MSSYHNRKSSGWPPLSAFRRTPRQIPRRTPPRRIPIQYTVPIRKHVNHLGIVIIGDIVSARHRSALCNNHLRKLSVMHAQGSNDPDREDQDVFKDSESSETAPISDIGPLPEVLTRREGAKLLRVSIATFGRLRLPRHLVGSSPRFLHNDLIEWLRGRGSGR